MSNSINNLPANTGWLWIKQGYRYFRKQPVELSALFLAYLFLLMMLGVVSYLTSELLPHLGQFLAFLFMPMVTMSFMQACREIDQGARVRPQLILYGLRSPQLTSLMLLGFLYFVAACIALSVSTLVDDGLLMHYISGSVELTQEQVQDSNISLAMLVAMLVYASAQLVLWFAAPLVTWHNMSLFKAIFYSFFAALKALRLFLVFALAWFTVAGIIPAMVAILIAALVGNSEVALMLILPLSMISTIILYCTFYPSYQSIFGQAAGSASSTIS